MAFNIEAFIWYLLLVDSLGCNIMAWCCSKWYKKNFKKFSKRFPASKGWCAYYLILILWVGFALYRLGVLPW